VVAPALVAEEQRLRRQINYWSWQVWRQADRAEAAERERFLRGRIDASLAEAAELEARLRRTVPAYAASLRSDFVDVATVQRETLDRDTVLLHYMLGKEHSYLWAVTTSTVTVSELPGRAVLEPLARGVYRLLQAGSAGAGDRGSLAQQHIAALSRHLLSPVADALADHRRLFVVPDGALHYVPFSLLIHPARSAPLVAFNDVAMLPSATTLGLLRRQTSSRAPAPKALAVLADPVFDALDSRVRVRSRAPAAAAAGGWIPRRLSRLPFSREEADRIAGLVAPAQRLKAVDFEASRALATSPQLADYRILHFATHAIQDDERPSLSGIVLSLVDESGSALDGFLRLHELYTLKLRADLVVLSACETGIGPGAGTGATAGGEGVSSLARGFFHAGAGRVVSTLWKVDDEATAAMMRFFYEALLADPAMAPAAALRTAQAEMRRQSRWRDPYFWAAFVIHGDW
jgi:CHAT domain-containing protein